MGNEEALEIETADEPVGAMVKWKARWRRVLSVLLAVALLPVLLHWIVGFTTRMSPPEITAPPAVELTEASQDASLRRLGRSYVRDRGAMREARLVGDPVANTFLRVPFMVMPPAILGLLV